MESCHTVICGWNTESVALPDSVWNKANREHREQTEWIISSITTEKENQHCEGRIFMFLDQIQFCFVGCESSAEREGVRG